MNFSKDLRKYREGLDDGKVTQEMLAMRMKIASSTYKRIETDKGPKFGIEVFGKLAVYFQKHNQLHLLLGLLGGGGLDIEKLRDDFEASQWRKLPELPPAPGKDYEGKPCGDSPYVQILHNDYGYPHIEGGWYDYIEKDWFVFSGDVILKENVFGWQYWLKVPPEMITKMEASDET